MKKEKPRLFPGGDASAFGDCADKNRRLTMLASSYNVMAYDNYITNRKSLGHLSRGVDRCRESSARTNETTPRGARRSVCQMAGSRISESGTARPGRRRESNRSRPVGQNPVCFANPMQPSEPRRMAEGEWEMKCPKCGHTFKATNQVKGGKARWAGISKAHRKQAASDAAKARWAKYAKKTYEHKN